MAAKKKNDPVRISANLPAEDFELLKDLSEKMSITMTDVIRRGIRDEKFFKRLKDEGQTLIIRDRDGRLNTVVQT